MTSGPRARRWLSAAPTATAAVSAATTIGARRIGRRAEVLNVMCVS
jgi:hypothetical protein